MRSPTSPHDMAVKHNGRVYQINYTGKMSDKDRAGFLKWATLPASVEFIADMKFELDVALQRRKLFTDEPPPSIGYAPSQWLRLIYNYHTTNTWSPLINKLFVAVHPKYRNLFNEKS